MNRRNFVVTTALLAALAIAPTACKKDSGGGGASGDMLSHLPKDSIGVVGVSWSKARSSALFKKYEKEMLSSSDIDMANIEQIKNECGIDLLADIKAIVVAGDTNPENAIVGVKGSFDQGKIEGCITKLGGSTDNGAYTVQGETTNAHWVAKDTVLLSEGLSADKIKAAASDGSIKDNADIMALISKVDTSATVWAAGIIPSELASDMGAMGNAPPKSAYLSLSVDSGLSARVGLIFSKGDEANASRSQLDGLLGIAKVQAPQFKDMIEGVSIKADGSSLIINAKLSGEQLEKLQSMAGSMPFR